MKYMLVKILFFLVIVNLAFSQDRGVVGIDEKLKASRFNEKFFYSIWIYPVQFEENLIVSYHIRYDNLLFEKSTTDTFQAKVKVIIELTSPDLLSPIRQIEEVVIKSKDFSQTISKDLYFTSNFSINAPKSKYVATLTVFDRIRNKDIEIKAFEVDLTDPNNFELVFIKENDLYQLQSDEIKNKFYNFLPFSSEKYLLLLPEKDELQNIEIKNEFIKYNLFIHLETGYKYNIYKLDTLDLIEGTYQFSFFNGKKSKSFNVEWIGKPEYLKKKENAYKLLKYLFENQNEAAEINWDGRNGNRKFYITWKKFDPTPSTPFNELMAEFYRRADFATNEFRSVSQPDGALTDRGKIYIIYGPPDKIDRTFAKDGRAIEIWRYNSSQGLRFTFLDENKNGNFILQK